MANQASQELGTRPVSDLIIVRVFTSDADIIALTPNALRVVFAITPLIAVQLIGSSFFQSIGKGFI